MDIVDRRQRDYEAHATRIAALVDSALLVYTGDGEVFEGPAITVVYPSESTVSLEEQERTLRQVADRLRTLRVRKEKTPVVLVRPADGVVRPFIEIACDIEHHRRMLATFAAMDPVRRAQMMRWTGVLPNVAELTREAAGWTDEAK